MDFASDEEVTDDDEEPSGDGSSDDEAYEDEMRAKTTERVRKAKKAKRARLQPEGWDATVSQPVSYCPADRFPIIINRRWSKKHVAYDTHEVDFINIREVENDEALALINAALGQKVKVHIKSPAGAFKQNMLALDTLYKTPKDGVRTEWNDRGQRLLTGQDFNNLPNVDLLADIRGNFPAPERAMKRLNREQKDTVIAMASAPLGV